MLTKKQIRRKILKERRDLSKESIKFNSEAIIKRISCLDVFKTANNFHLYYPINNEVDTIELINYLWKEDKNVIMPRTDFKNKLLRNYLVTDLNQLEETYFNMLEPKETLELFLEEIDIVIVPGVAFDRKCNRMGYGGGFYDRFLNDSKALKIAFSHNIQLMDIIPFEEHDIKMDYIITEKEIISKEQL